VAQPGDSIAVAGGLYLQDAPQYGGTGIWSAAKGGAPITFVCAGGDVTFAGPLFFVWAGAGGVSFRGSCFRFHLVAVGLGGYAARTHDVVFDGVHMDSFNISGAANVTIANSEVGPFVMCYGPGFEPAYARCDPNSADPLERYWATRSDAGDVQQEPYIHSGAAGVATNITLDHDHIHGLSSKWSGTHTGGLLVWDSDGLTIRNSTFDHNAIYDLQFNAGSNDSNLTIENNTLSYPVYSQDPTEPNPGGELPIAFREGLGTGTGPNTTATNWLIRYNRLAHGFTTDGLPGTTYNNVRVIGNNMGASPICGPPHPGLTFTNNTACG